MDRAYEGDKTRELCQSFGHKPIVPPKKNRINPWEYDHELYKQRNIIERLFRWLKAFRRICTRYDKRDLIFLSFIQIACIFMWLKQCQQALERLKYFLMKGRRACWSIDGGNRLAALLCKHYSVHRPSGTDIASNHDNYNSPLSVAKTPKKDGKGYEFNRNISFPSRFKWLKQISICKPFSELNF